MSWEGKSVLITGGFGFIGSHLVSELVKSAASCVATLDLLSGWDLRTLDWKDWLHNFDVIFHFAANAYVPPSVDNPIADYETNCTATLRMLDAMRIHQWKGKLVYASSAAVYGDTPGPLTETSLTVPVSPYGCGKLAAERYVNVYAQLYGLKMASLRLFSVYGPGQQKQVVYDLMVKIKDSVDIDIPLIKVHGDGSQVRDFLYVEDAVQAAMLVAEKAQLTGEVYNVASGKETTIHELVDTLRMMMGDYPYISYTGMNRPGDPEKLTVDISRLQDLGYVPQTKFEDGVAHTVEWFNGLG